MVERISQYLREHYGVCLQSETTGECPCLFHKRNQHLCEHYTPVIAKSWEDMMERAKSMYTQRSEKDVPKTT